MTALLDRSRILSSPAQRGTLKATSKTLRRGLGFADGLGDAAGGHRLDLGTDGRTLVEQVAEILAIEPQQTAVAVGDHVGVARLVGKQAHLAEEVALL